MRVKLGVYKNPEFRGLYFFQAIAQKQ